MQTIADGMIADGVTVLAIVNLDSDSGSAIEEKAKKQGVQTIDYDRLTLGGSADVYISYDNSKVGALQGEGLKKCLGDKDANLIYLNGSPTDNNATLFSQGAHSVLDEVTTYKNVAEQAVPDWDNDKAVTIFEQLYTKVDGKVDASTPPTTVLPVASSRSSRRTVRPARSPSRVRTPRSRVCRTSS